MRCMRFITGFITVIVAVVAIGATDAVRIVARTPSFDDLMALFDQWRAFQHAPLVDGVPQYTAAAMKAQHTDSAKYRKRLETIDPSGWPVPQQIDWYLVRAEMDGLDFDHRVLRPWERDPAFYVTVFAHQSDQPAREGPHADGAVELWRESFPLSPEAIARIAPGIRAIPGLLEQARTNLTGNARDLWVYGTQSVKEQQSVLADLGTRVSGAPESFTRDVKQATAATDAFVSWLEARTASKTGPSGIGIEDYNWYLKHVQLVPYTWQEEVALMERELARAEAALAFEEHRNEKLPVQAPIANADDYARLFDSAIREYMTFLRERDILTIRDYMEPALRGRMGRFREGPREFFTEVNYRDPLVMRTHDYHWFDLGRLAHEPHADPVRRGPLLYNIFVTRTEGFATAWEEMMLQAGMFDARPRSRELIYVLLAERAARALGDLRMHANEFTLEEAARFASTNTPRGWLRLDANTVREEQHLYLQQPAYGTSYMTGKIQAEALLAAARRAGSGFRLHRFMDDLNAAGLIPMALLRWELTGERPDDVARMLAH